MIARGVYRSLWGALVVLAVVGCARVIELSEEARSAADHQLDLIDRAEYARSWSEASVIFRDAVTQEDWSQRAAAIRGPLGTLQQRHPRAAVGKTDPASSPKGEYIMVTYDTAFERNPEVVETLVLYQDDDAQWRMAGYFVK